MKPDGYVPSTRPAEKAGIPMQTRTIPDATDRTNRMILYMIHATTHAEKRRVYNLLPDDAKRKVFHFVNALSEVENP